MFEISFEITFPTLCELLWRGSSGSSPAKEIFIKTKRKDINIFFQNI